MQTFKVYTKLSGKLAVFSAEVDPLLNLTTSLARIRTHLQKEGAKGAVLALVPKAPEQLELF